MDWITRKDSLDKLLPFMDKNIVKVITGIRRCGKSVMLELVQKHLIENGIEENRMLAMNFESRQDPRVESVDSVLNAIESQRQGLSKGKQKAEKRATKPGERNRKHGERLYLFFDEIQELDGWEKLVNSLLIDEDVDIYITGSNANLLSGELATYLAGRYVEVKMYPFSFAEILQVLGKNNLNDPNLNMNSLFLTYIIQGGFPFLYNYNLNDADSKQYLNDIFDSIALKDITQRYKVRDVSQFRQLILYFIANIGNTFSASSLTKYLKSQQRNLSTETIYNYIDYSRSANLLHLASRNDLIGKSILSTQEKIYLTDHGLREAIYGNNQRDISQVLENIVYIELLRRGYTVTVGKFKDREIDFVADKGNKRIYIQVAYLLATEETMEREFSVLESIPDNHPKYVLSLDEYDRSRNGIIHRKIPDFLLAKEI